MQTIELFSGTKSFSKIAKAHGFSVLTIDNNPSHAPDLCIDIANMPAEAVPKNATILWASPPCEGFSIAAVGRNWNRDRTPKHSRAINAQLLVLKTLDVIKERQPHWWFIENPRGMLRKMDFMGEYRRETITYCQYGDTRQKPTDIWTNAHWWKPRPMCRPGALCHEAAPRGSKNGTQGLRNAVERARIPPALFEDIFSQFAQAEPTDPSLQVAA